jgi:hypothetical protein
VTEPDESKAVARQRRNQAVNRLANLADIFALRFISVRDLPVYRCLYAKGQEWSALVLTSGKVVEKNHSRPTQFAHAHFR